MSTVTPKYVSMVLNIGLQRSEEEIVLSILSGRGIDHHSNSDSFQITNHESIFISDQLINWNL